MNRQKVKDLASDLIGMAIDFTCEFGRRFVDFVNDEENEEENEADSLADEPASSRLLDPDLTEISVEEEETGKVLASIKGVECDCREGIAIRIKTKCVDWRESEKTSE